MTTRQILAKVNLRCNKAASEDYDNVWRYQVKEAYNKSVLDIIRRMIKGKTNTLEGDEETTSRIDDLQVLLVTDSLVSRNKGKFNETEKIPKDYLYYKRISPIVSKDNCSEVAIRSDLKQEANVDSFLDYPSFDFEETFHTIKGNRFYIYHNDEFKINSVFLTYYRTPKFVDFTKLDEVIEFKDDFCELVVDQIASLINSDMESPNQVQLADKRTESII